MLPTWRNCALKLKPRGGPRAAVKAAFKKRTTIAHYRNARTKDNDNWQSCGVTGQSELCGAQLDEVENALSITKFSDCKHWFVVAVSKFVTCRNKHYHEQSVSSHSFSFTSTSRWCA